MDKQAAWLAAYVEKCMVEAWGVELSGEMGSRGDVLTFRSGTADCGVWVEADDPAMVRVMATAVTGVRPTAKLLREVNEINTSSRVATVWWHDGSVVVECSLFAEAVDAGTLSEACLHVGQLANDIGVGFAALYDGSTPYAAFASDSEDAT